jgi:hypothetical protein
MQPNDDDARLRGLLREWKAPETPPSLEQRVLRSRAKESPKESWWRFLIGGYIRVPVSVACGVALLLTAAVWRVSVRPPAPCVAEQTAAPASRVARTLPQDRCDHPAPGVC